MSNFDELKKYIGLDEGCKRFYPVQNVDISKAEDELGFLFPQSLKDFYMKIGYGWFADNNDSGLANLFIHPLGIVDLYKNVSEFSPPEGFLKGDLPMFNCGDNRFLVVRPKSSTPSIIFRDDGKDDGIANDVKNFVDQLLVNPCFYEKK